ncbi:ArsR/SmtB family transcription factor [Leeuwenhoekiella sp. MAR_2009_132]|uniref:ArsR/SmtB family transcription factor n=1 Tax=Leeuwenhoekiella sp. MAR_2009_132 TaxID=1392489 RepID=UPI00048ED034|nr:metalloregulator ArsR/SmtB family transcription factor [Leeuwenhoekiella sp. MAR_2009_132]
MGLTKEILFTEYQNEMALYAKALAHPARIAILQELFKSKTCICGDLVNQLGLAQPTISQHLKELKKVNLIKGTIEGVRVCYCLNQETLQLFSEKFKGLFELNEINEQSDCC